MEQRALSLLSQPNRGMPASGMGPARLWQTQVSTQGRAALAADLIGHAGPDPRHRPVGGQPSARDRRLIGPVPKPVTVAGNVWVWKQAKL